MSTGDPSRRSVHGVGRRRRHRRVPDLQVSADGPDGRLVRVLGSDGLVRARGARPVERWVMTLGGVIFLVVLVGLLRDPTLHDGWVPMLVISPAALVVVRVIRISVHADGDALVIDQGVFRWVVPAGAIVEVGARCALLVGTERREISAVALAHRGEAEDEHVLRAVEAVERWVEAARATGHGEAVRERASGWVVLRDGAAVVVMGQLLWLAAVALRPVG